MPEHNLPSDAFETYTPSQPISAALFAEAIQDLPLDTLYAKAAEIQNSVSHLLDSNIQMKPFADEGDEVCKEAIHENDAVIERMQERLELCKSEAARRGSGWSGHAAGNGDEEESKVNGVDGHASDGQAPPTAANVASSGRLTDEELLRQLEAQMGTEGGDAEDGVHL